MIEYLCVSGYYISEVSLSYIEVLLSQLSDEINFSLFTYTQRHVS